MSIEYLVTVGIIFIAALVGIVFLIPGERKKKDKKKALLTEIPDEQKELEQKILRLEKHIRSYRNDALELKKNEKAIEKQILVERVKVKKLEEKLSQERQWHNKEQDVIDKKGREFQELKSELVKFQESFSKEHAANLRFEHKVKELEDQINSLNDQRRMTEGENAQLKAQVENSRREISQLKKENRQLTKVKEDASWVTKDEYERVAKLLKEKEKKLEQNINSRKEKS